MRVTILIAILTASLTACQSNQQTEETKQETTVVTEQPVAVAEKTKTYLVVTSWITNDRQKAMDHVPNQQKQLMSLWNKGIVENIYYNQKGKFNDGKPLSLTAFFIKGANEDDVRSTLDTADVVKNSLATYTLREVGENIYSRSENAIKLGTATDIESFAVVWTLSGSRADRDTTTLSAQAAMTSQLQEVGIIENGYIDTSAPTSKSNGTRPAVFFINAKNQAGARKVLDEMPIVKAKQASYGLQDVGQFFTGIKK